MEQQFSPGLLYSVAPENFSELHLQNEVKNEPFEWEQQKTALDSFVQTIRSSFHKLAGR